MIFDLVRVSMDLVSPLKTGFSFLAPRPARGMAQMRQSQVRNLGFEIFEILFL